MWISVYVDMVSSVDNIQLLQSRQLSQRGEVASTAVVVDEQRTPARLLPAPAASAAAAAATAAAATAPTATTAPHGNDNGSGAATWRCRESTVGHNHSFNFVGKCNEFLGLQPQQLAHPSSWWLRGANPSLPDSVLARHQSNSFNRRYFLLHGH